jgi:hypothetical protein
MRTIALLSLAAGIVLSAAGPASPAVAGRPMLRVVPGDSLGVRGSGFKPSERIRLSAQTREGSRTRTVKASAAGTFVARWNAAADYCSGIFLVRATDSTGRTVSLRVAPITQDCAPPAP